MNFIKDIFTRLFNPSKHDDYLHVAEVKAALEAAPVVTKSEPAYVDRKPDLFEMVSTLRMVQYGSTSGQYAALAKLYAAVPAFPTTLVGSIAEMEGAQWNVIADVFHQAKTTLGMLDKDSTKHLVDAMTTLRDTPAGDFNEEFLLNDTRRIYCNMMDWVCSPGAFHLYNGLSRSDLVKTMIERGQLPSRA